MGPLATRLSLLNLPLFICKTANEEDLLLMMVEKRNKVSLLSASRCYFIVISWYDGAKVTDLPDVLLL